MNTATQKLSSLRLTTWILIVLAGWLVWGIRLAGSVPFTPGFRSMNDQLVRSWLLAPDTGFPLLKFWFVGLCLVMVVLGINLGFCSWHRMLKILKRRLDGPRMFMLFVHALFGLVALGHFCGFMFGYEHNGIRLQAGKSWDTPDGYRIAVTDVRFTDDPRVLGKSRRNLLRDEFHVASNTVSVVLSRQGEALVRKEVCMLDPLRYRGLQVTLMRFVRPGDTPGTSAVSPAVVVNVSRHPVLGIFLMLYPLMIVGMLVHLGMTWRRSDGERPA